MCMAHTTDKITRWARSQVVPAVIDPALVTKWLPAHGVAALELRVLSEIRARSGNYRHYMSFQTAPVSTDFPDAWTVSGTARATDNVFVEDFPAVAWTDKLWVRAGLSVGASAGIGEAQASIQAMVAGRSKIIAARTIELQPDLNATTTGIYPITGAFPAASLTEVMVACILSGVNGTVTYQPVVRFFNRLDMAPGAWTLLIAGGGAVSPAANEFRNFGGHGVTPGANLWAQVGIQVTTAPRATIESIVSAKY